MKSENVVQIRYCCISYRDVILVSHQTEAENYTPMVHSILRTLDIREDRKLASPVDRFQVHVLIESGIAYTCVTHLTNKHYLQFSFLETMKEKFLEVPSLHIRAVTASENEFERDFCPVIASVVGSIFRQGAHDVRVKMRCKNLKMWFVIGGLLTVVLTFAILLACGVIHL
ncbi:uncharacterized protein LOC110839275 isoform X2 [Zootermopsis nevadensis]|uniref:uncharacterized protein LOC110839275 isoform X2 n=1 Tax=Zootermopsis nevadensis TaxID=136037 RepID=UPI000B8E4CA6|nr:uncharacterized protein LOC110839275 isoform X2 [Zootermopsis nevadensis]